MEENRIRPAETQFSGQKAETVRYRRRSGKSEYLQQFYISALLKSSIVPLLLLGDLFKAKSEHKQRLLITLFFAIFGSTMLIGGDAIRHQWFVENHYVGLSFGQFFEELWLILTLRMGGGGAKDVYNHLVSYFFGGVLEMPRLYIPFVATVYGYFFAGSVTHVLRNFSLSRTNHVILAMVFVFIFFRGLEGLQTVRTWTGMWVLLFACLKYHETRQMKYLVLMFVPPFIHFGYFVMAIPAWLVLVAGSRPALYSGILIASTVTNFFPAPDFTELVSRTERGESSLHWYSVEEETDMRDRFQEELERTNWYNAYRKAGFHRWAPTVLILALIAAGLYLRGMTLYQQKIMSIGVLTLASSNMFWFVYALHNRMMIVGSIFILSAFLMARLDPSTKQHFIAAPPYYKAGVYLSLLLFFPWILFTLSLTADRLSVYGLFVPIVVWFDPELNMSAKALINFLLGRG
jgi:hypothetical protein